jgi:hypothetical protein
MFDSRIGRRFDAHHSTTKNFLTDSMLQPSQGRNRTEASTPYVRGIIHSTQNFVPSFVPSGRKCRWFDAPMARRAPSGACWKPSPTELTRAA